MKDDRDASPDACAGKPGYITWEEERVLKRMREMKEEVAKTRAEIARLSKEDRGTEELEAANEKLEMLKRTFKDLEAQRDEARTHKMRALGHEE